MPLAQADGGGSAPGAERRVILLVAAVQFVHIVDFTMILPLGPDFTEPLGIPPSALGLLAAAYAGAAALVGLASAPLLDRFGRRAVLLVAMTGLSVATLGAALATGLGGMLLARGLAGAFGGPAAAMGQSIVTDAVPEQRRGRAMSVVLGANALAAVLGVPIGLWLSDRFDWRAPFVATGLAAAIVTVATPIWLPELRGHMAGLRADAGLGAMLGRAAVRRAYALVFLVVCSAFLLTPNLSTFVQANLGLARTDLPPLYALAGVASIATMRLVGHIVDRRGAFGVGSLAVAAFAAFGAGFLLLPAPLLPIPAGFVLLLVALGSRNVAVRTLATRVPGAHERARFLSLQSSVHHTAAAIGALGAAAWLTSGPDGRLVGMPTLAAAAIALTLPVPALLWSVEREAVPRSAS